MPPKPRNTVSRPSKASPITGTSTTSNPSTTTSSNIPASFPSGEMRKRRWFYSKPSLVVLLMLQPFMLVFAFVLLTEPCLNPEFKNTLRSKLNYVSLLSTPGVPAEEWGSRFGKAGVRALFGTGVVQVWFVARLNGYVQRASMEHERIVTVLKGEGEGEGKEEKPQAIRVGSFIRQLESVSLTLLALPLIIALFYSMLVLAGAPAWDHKLGTLVIATQLALLIGLPILHILGLPPSQLEPSPPSSTTLHNPSKLWSSLLSLNPNPTFLLPLYYPPILTLTTTILSTAPLALDWQLPWQTYPYSLLVGSITGLTLGNLYTVFVVTFG